MNKYIPLLSFMALLILAACSPKKLTTTTTTASTKTDVAKDNTPPELMEGKTIWQGNCGNCHTLYSPSSRNIASWEKILPPMARKAKLDDDAAAKVRAYVLAYALK